MAVATIVDSTAVANSSFTMAVPRPVGLQNGDYVFVIAHGRGSAVLSTPPAGFTEFINFATGSTASQVRSIAWYKLITDAGTEPATYDIVYSNTNPFGSGIAVAVRGAHASVPVAVGESATVTGSGATVACPSITTGGDERLVFTSPANNTGVTSGNTWAPTSVTELEDAGNRVYGALGHTTQATAGTVAAETWTITSVSPGAATGLTFAVQPAGANNPPVADAGPDQTGHVGDLITLDGSNSSDAEGISSYQWTQLTGPAVTLNNADTAIATFTPTVAGSYSFRLTVTDTHSQSAFDDTKVTIYPTGVDAGAFVSGTSTSVSANLPAAAQIGDVAVMFVAHQAHTSASLAAGWMPLATGSSGTSSTQARIWGMYKQLQAGDIGSSAVVPLAQNSRWCAAVITFSELHPLHPVLRSLGSDKLGKPDIDGLVINGTPGTTTYEYVATAIDEAGETTASSPVSTTTGPNTLSAANSINVWFDPVFGATNYRIYGRTPGGPHELIATVDNTNVTGVSTNQKRGITDTGTATTAINPPSAYPQKVHWDCLDADDPGRLRTNFTGGFALHAAALRAPSPTPGFALTSTPANTIFLGQHLHGENQVLLGVLFEELAGSGDLLSGRVSDFNTATEAWAGLSIILRPAGANGPPTAVAGVDFTAFSGSKVYLDASLAYDVDEDNLSYSWAQIAGTTVTLNDANTANPWFIAPSSAGSLTFQLTVTDPSSASSMDNTVITVVEPPSAVKVYKNGSFNTIQIKTYQSGEWV